MNVLVAAPVVVARLPIASYVYVVVAEPLKKPVGACGLA
jgi:hypothetical protein